MDNNNYLNFLKGRRGLLREDADIINYEGDGIKPGMEAKDEKETNDPEEHIEGTGTEQAGTSDSDSFAGMADDLEDMLSLDESAELLDIKGVKEDADIISYEGDGVKPGMGAKDEKETNDPEEHSEGSGTEQAGTSDSDSFAGMADDLDDLLALEEGSELSGQANKSAADAGSNSPDTSMASAKDVGIKEDILLFMNEDVENMDEQDSAAAHSAKMAKMIKAAPLPRSSPPSAKGQLTKTANAYKNIASGRR